MSNYRPASRREFLSTLAGATAVVAVAGRSAATEPVRFRLRYVLSTSVYGTLPVADIAAEAPAAGCEGLDIWGGRWGNQREQIRTLGVERFAEMLAARKTRVCCFTCMDTGFPEAQEPLRLMRILGGDTLVAMLPGGIARAKDLRGDELKRGIRATVEKLKPIVALAGEQGAKLAIENHAGGLLATPESLAMLLEAIPERHVGVAFAPYHLPQEPARLGKLVGDLGERVLFFYAWQHGDGSGDLAPSQQRRQLPGVGPLDFKPMLAALRRHRFAGWAAIFMHPTPRGAPMFSTPKEITAELKKVRAYLDAQLAAA
jgi:sugar phosphate isomerase/epimerase